MTKADIKIAKRARQILGSPRKWNRADTRVCPPEATTFSLYCALEKATDEVSANFEHRGAAIQEARFVIDDISPKVKEYDHRLMGYNDDPSTTFPEIQSSMEPSRRSGSQQFSHHQAQVERTGMNEQPLDDVVVMPKVESVERIV